MLKPSNKLMDSKIVIFSILVLAAIFTMMLPIDSVIAQTSNMSTDKDSEHKDGNREGKSCPFKDKKNASVDASLNI